MGKSLQIWCRMSMNFCECIVNILEIWHLKCIFESLNLRDGHPKKFGFELQSLFVLVPFNPSLKSYGHYKLENMVNDQIIGKSQKNT